MIITINWTIDGMDVVPNKSVYTNVVSNIHWRVLATYENYMISVYGEESIEYQLRETFIPYEELTQETVINWVKQTMGIEKVTEIENMVTEKLNNLVNPEVVALSLPWN